MIPAAFAAAWQALDRRLDPLSRAPVAVALSGGGDSLALLRIARAWTGAAGRPLWALTLDHRLHPHSAAWTQAAGEAAHQLGVGWCSLVWTGPKPSTGLPTAARRARHAQLAEAARALGARVLLVGHTADDVAESELIRAHTPTHGRLAEWSPSPAWPQGRDVFILRPLLSQRRADLRAWLAGEGVAWLEDPANADMRFARTRARIRLAAAAVTGPAPPVGDGAKLAPDPRRDGRSTQAPQRRWTVDDTLERFGVLALALDPLTNPPADLLAKALLCVSGGTSPPSGLGVERLLARIAAGEVFTATLCGARVQAGAGRLRLTRELGRTPPAAILLEPGTTEVFDGRFELIAKAPGWRVAPLAGHAASLPPRDRTALQAVPAEARSSLPVLIGPGGEVRPPSGSGPATARSRVGNRLAAALGLLPCERVLEQASRACNPVAPRSRSSYLEL